MANLAERIYIEAIAAELGRINDPAFRTAAMLQDHQLAIDDAGCARFAIAAAKTFRRVESEGRLPLPEPKGPVTSG